MNWGRFLPQIVFSVRAYLHLLGNKELGGVGSGHGEGGEGGTFGAPLDIVVPTGNFGNILGVVYAKLVLGLPIRRIVCASNANNILFEFLRTGRYDLRAKAFTQTMSPSIDILVSSNLERFLHLLCTTTSERAEVKRWFESLARDGWFEVSPPMLKRMQSVVQAGWATEQQCLDTIRDTMQRTGVLIGTSSTHTRTTTQLCLAPSFDLNSELTSSFPSLWPVCFTDPHTAVAVHVANALLGPASEEGSGASSSSTVPVVVASTAHYAKFPNAMCLAMGKGQSGCCRPSSARQ